jgi:Ca-activated chloride channel family protein
LAKEPVNLLGITSEFNGLAGDVRFDRAWATWLFLWPIAWFIVRRVQPRFPLRGQVVVRSNRFGRTLWLLAISLLIIGFAGPHWGKSKRDGVAIGRDLVIVIDLSRSMQATDLSDARSRWKTATDAAGDLVRAASVRGGHRIGIVIFAAKPKLLVPLTTDYGHLLQSLDELDGDARPLEIRPDETASTGTRIGAALKLAVESHDARYPGVQDIVLLSDGDDPAEDREWAQGISPARTAGIPIHTVGIGDTESTPLVLKKKGSADGELVTTKLHEEVLQEIAREAKGTYLPAGREPPRLGEFFHRSIEPLPSRELSDDAVEARKDRSGWFFTLGFVFFLLAWWRAPL